LSHKSETGIRGFLILVFSRSLHRKGYSLMSSLTTPKKIVVNDVDAELLSVYNAKKHPKVPAVAPKKGHKTKAQLSHTKDPKEFGREMAVLVLGELVVQYLEANGVDFRRNNSGPEASRQKTLTESCQGLDNMRSICRILGTPVDDDKFQELKELLQRTNIVLAPVHKKTERKKKPATTEAVAATKAVVVPLPVVSADESDDEDDDVDVEDDSSDDGEEEEARPVEEAVSSEEEEEEESA